MAISTYTPVQEQAFAPISAGENVLAISPTGSGKTLAFLWPTLLSLKAKQGQQLLILAPNSELAGQLFEVAKTWAHPLSLNVQLFLSGSSQKRQIERLKKAPEILIGTPGRIFELVKLKKIKLMAINTIVLDEYDHLLEASQYQFVQKILSYVPKDHQLIFTSATDAVIDSNLPEPLTRISISQEQDTLTHYYLQVEARDKVETLRKLSHLADMRALVFFNQLSDVGNAEEKLLYRQANVASLASDVNVKFRKTILERFKNHHYTLLLVTDILARGIDIEQLEWVINADLPVTQESFTHRIGRTGRMGQTGNVLTFISNSRDLKTLKRYTQNPLTEVKIQRGQLVPVSKKG
nr:DEAD/DEAH box helicase [Streptococcus sp. DD12]